MFPAGFQTPQSILRPIGPADAPAIFDSWAQDSRVARYLSWRPHQRIEDTQAYIGNCLAAQTSRTYVLIDRRDGKLHGAFDVRRYNLHWIGYGYVLAQSSWGQGRMSEALSEVVRWALNQTDIWRVGDFCDVENRASARVMEKCAMSCEGVLRRWLLAPNLSDQPRDCLSFAKVKS
jgi:RimJ/RimL family protein N-acetyltransferase